MSFLFQIVLKQYNIQSLPSFFLDIIFILFQKYNMMDDRYLQQTEHPVALSARNIHPSHRQILGKIHINVVIHLQNFHSILAVASYPGQPLDFFSFLIFCLFRCVPKGMESKLRFIRLFYVVFSEESFKNPNYLIVQ